MKALVILISLIFAFGHLKAAELVNLSVKVVTLHGDPVPIKAQVEKTEQSQIVYSNPKALVDGETLALSVFALPAIYQQVCGSELKDMNALTENAAFNHRQKKLVMVDRNFIATDANYHQSALILKSVSCPVH